MASQNNSLCDLLNSTLVKDLPINKHKLIKVKSEQKIKEVLEIFNKHDILSAPVYDASKHTYIGIVDLRDFVAFVLSTYVIGEPVVNTADRLSDLSGVNPFVPVNDNQILLEAIRDFNVNHVNRMPVIDHEAAANSNDPEEPHPPILNILSQSDVVEWLSHHIDKCGSQIHLTLKDLNFGGLGRDENVISQAITAKESDSVLHVLSILEKFRIQGVPVESVAESHLGELINEFDVKDIKYVVPSSLDDLNITLKDFFTKFHDRKHPFVSCSVDTKFSELIHLMTKNKVHRVHIVDDKNRPVDVVTMTNVLDTVLVLATGSRRR